VKYCVNSNNGYYVWNVGQCIVSVWQCKTGKGHWLCSGITRLTLNLLDRCNPCGSWSQTKFYICMLCQGCSNTRCQVTWTTKFCVVVPNFFQSSVQKIASCHISGTYVGKFLRLCAVLWVGYKYHSWNTRTFLTLYL